MAEKGKCQVCSKFSESRCSWCKSVFYCSKEHQKQDWETHKAVCTKKKYTMECNEKLGRHLVATEDIKADWILLKDRPILLSIKANSLEFTPNKICLGCYKEIKVDEGDDDSSDSSDGEPMPKSVCWKCQLPICSRECSQHYFHKAFECRLISEANLQPHQDAHSNIPQSDNQEKGAESCSMTLSTEVGNEGPVKVEDVRETISRHLIYFRSVLLKTANAGFWEEMMNLQSDEEERRDVQSLERTTRVFTTVKKVLERINHPTINQVYKPDVHKILGILDINALHFNISSSANDVEVSALFPTFSLLEHSCVPNVRHYLVAAAPKEGDKKRSNKYLFELYCRSAVKIRKGDRLSVAYVNLMWNTDKRREFLRKEKGFWCTCPRCEDPTELGTNFSTIKCSQEGCSGYAVPTEKGWSQQQQQPEIHWKCCKCGKFTMSWQVKKVDTRLCEMVGRAKASLESYKQLLSKINELVHPDYYLCFVLNHSLVQMYGEGGDEDESKIHDPQMLEDKVALCNRLLSTIRKLDPGLSKLNIYAAVIYYEMQSAILAMIGGEVDDDYKILRYKPEKVKLARLYLVKCIDCFKYEFLEVPENKLKNLAQKKLEYLNFLLTKFQPSKTAV